MPIHACQTQDSLGKLNRHHRLRSQALARRLQPDHSERLRDINRTLIEAELVDCMVAFPGQRFYSMQIPVCL